MLSPSPLFVIFASFSVLHFSSVSIHFNLIRYSYFRTERRELSPDDADFFKATGYSWDMVMVFDAADQEKRPYGDSKSPIYFELNKKIYLDRDITVTKIPEQLAGCMILQSTNNKASREVSDSTVFMVIDAQTSPVTLFVCADGKARTQPDWLVGDKSPWKDTGLEIRGSILDDKQDQGKTNSQQDPTKDIVYAVYSASFNLDESRQIKLRGCLPHHDPSSRNNYFVLQVPDFNQLKYAIIELEDFSRLWPCARVVSALNSAGLETKLIQPNDSQIFCLIRARPSVIAEHAERMDLLMHLEPQKLKELAMAGHNFGDGRQIRPLVLTNEVLEPIWGKGECRDPYGDHYARYSTVQDGHDTLISPSSHCGCEQTLCTIRYFLLI
jgi:hypothetical protein